MDKFVIISTHCSQYGLPVCNDFALGDEALSRLKIE